MAFRVLVTARQFGASPAAVEALNGAGCETILLKPYVDVGDGGLGGDELVKALEHADAMIAGPGANVDRYVLERAPDLKLITRRGVGYDSVDVAAARELGIAVSITAGANHEAVADHVFALLLSFARGVVQGHTDMMAGIWKPSMGIGLPGKTIGIIGLGRIGKGVARRARGFSMNVLAVDPIRDDAFAREFGVRYAELDEVLREADVISVNAALGAGVAPLIRRETIEKMKASAIVINTARGSLVDEAALAQALQSGRIAGAGIDVFADEGSATSPLIGAPNVVLSPHNAASTNEAYDLSNLIAAQTAANFMRGVWPSPDCTIVPPGSRAPAPAGG